MTVLPQSVPFAFRQTKLFKTIPMKIPQPERSLGILGQKNAPSLSAPEKLQRLIGVAFDDLRTIFLRHENAVIWGA